MYLLFLPNYFTVFPCEFRRILRRLLLWYFFVFGFLLIFFLSDDASDASAAKRPPKQQLLVNEIDLTHFIEGDNGRKSKNNKICTREFYCSRAMHGWRGNEGRGKAEEEE